MPKKRTTRQMPQYVPPPEPAGVWQARDRGDCFDIVIGGKRLSVHRHIDYSRDVWLYTFGYEGHRLLDSKDIEKAKIEALERVAVWANAILTDARRAQTP